MKKEEKLAKEVATQNKLIALLLCQKDFLSLTQLMLRLNLHSANTFKN